ncbi:LexA family transcriptional regulator [Halomonas sp. H33-56]|uniref:XRE family transcriptional regulator n=1 Tax=Halomonas sp. H33-56 TaxID=2950873 RepID=UPI0032DF78E0
MSDTREIISTRLAAARRDLGLTIEEAAQRMKFTRSRLSNWELGIRAPKYEELETAARVLGVTPAYLTGWDASTPGAGYRPADRNTITHKGETTRIANATDVAAYSPAYLAQHGLDANQLMAIRVDDDTMANVIRSGDVVLADMTRTRSDSRPDLFAILVGDRAWVRRIRPELDGTYTLSAEDSRQYPDQNLTRAQLDDMTIIGRIARIERDS